MNKLKGVIWLVIIMNEWINSKECYLVRGYQGFKILSCLTLFNFSILVVYWYQNVNFIDMEILHQIFVLCTQEMDVENYGEVFLL